MARRFNPASVAALVLLTLAGCPSSDVQVVVDGGGAGTVPDDEGTTPVPDGGGPIGVAPQRYRLAVIPKGTTHEFWKSVHAGAQQAADELGNVEILWKGAILENDTGGQIDVVQNFITSRVDGIVLAPNDSQSLVSAVAEAKEAGIPTVIFDSGLDDTEIIVSYVATHNYTGGQLAARRLAEVLGKKGEVGLLRYKQGSQSTEQREQGFLDTIEKEFPDMKVIVDDQYAGTTPEESLDTAQRVLDDLRSEIDGIFAVCEPNATGVLGALRRDEELAAHVKFVGFDPSEEMVQALRDNQMQGIVLQDPVRMGYEAVKIMVAHLNGEEVPKEVDSGVDVATPENMNDPKIDKLLNPKRFEE
jgi:ribose transport system substrate-binding protein